MGGAHPSSLLMLLVVRRRALYRNLLPRHQSKGRTKRKRESGEREESDEQSPRAALLSTMYPFVPTPLMVRYIFVMKLVVMNGPACWTNCQLSIVNCQSVDQAADCLSAMCCKPQPYYSLLRR